MQVVINHIVTSWPQCYDTRMKITVFGAGGKVGRLIVEGALAAGDEVVAFVHHDPHFLAHPRLSIVRGDVHNAEDVTAAIKGSDAVISALGSWGTKKKDIVSTGMAAIIPAMQANSVRRVVSLTGSDARARGDSLGFVHRLSHVFIKYSPAAKILADGEWHVELLEQSDLDWTVVRSPVMNTRGDREGFSLTSTRPLPWATINRHSVVSAMLGLARSRDHLSQAPFIVRD